MKKYTALILFILIFFCRQPVFAEEAGQQPGPDQDLPRISMSEDCEKMRTDSETIVFAGDVEPGTRLYLDEKEIEVESNGIFAYKYNLRFGNNNVVFVAIGEDGRESYYLANVTRVISAGVFRLAVTIVIGIAALAFMVFLAVKKKKTLPGNREEGIHEEKI